jgi:hypothetical protein
VDQKRKEIKKVRSVDNHLQAWSSKSMSLRSAQKLNSLRFALRSYELNPTGWPLMRNLQAAARRTSTGRSVGKGRAESAAGVLALL